MRAARAIDPETVSAADRVLADHQGYLALSDQFFALVAAGRIDAAERLEAARIAPLERHILDQVADLATDSATDSDEAHRELRRQARLLQLGAPVALGAGLLLLGLVALVTRSFRRTVENQAAYDPLTGLPNRTRFQSRCDALLAEAAGTPTEPAVRR